MQGYEQQSHEFAHLSSFTTSEGFLVEELIERSSTLWNLLVSKAFLAEGLQQGHGQGYEQGYGHVPGHELGQGQKQELTNGLVVGSQFNMVCRFFISLRQYFRAEGF